MHITNTNICHHHICLDEADDSVVWMIMTDMEKDMRKMRVGQNDEEEEGGRGEVAGWGGRGENVNYLLHKKHASYKLCEIIYFPKTNKTYIAALYTDTALFWD